MTQRSRRAESTASHRKLAASERVPAPTNEKYKSITGGDSPGVQVRWDRPPTATVISKLMAICLLYFAETVLTKRIFHTFAA
jgi:hypothetical protein